jgi:hypothetical protein
LSFIFIKNHYNEEKITEFITNLAGFGLYAAPFKNMPVYFTQPDGTQYHCFASGDEYYHYLHDGNGFVIIQNQDGWFYYATHDANGEQVASRYKAGRKRSGIGRIAAQYAYFANGIPEKFRCL